MLVKIANQVHNSDKEIITLILTAKEKEFIRNTLETDNAITLSPIGTPQPMITRFNNVFKGKKETA